MASEKLFQGTPPFPGDVRIAPMTTIRLASLRSGDGDTLQSILVACQELGFFLLDLHGDDLGEETIREIDELFGVAETVMNLPDDVKQQYIHDSPRSFLGWKPRGDSKIETQEPDRFEWFNLGQDGLMGNAPPQSLPDPLQTKVELLKSFLNHGQGIISIISRSLAEQLHLAADTFTSLQSPSKPSGTVIRMIRAFSFESAGEEHLRTSMVHHTDHGTVTLLANVMGGLQILSPGKSPTDTDGDAWLWVRPRPGCLIVNLGDAMVQWTGGLLRSNVHRIKYAPGEQRFVDRYSVAMLARPERDASMRRLAGDDDDDDENAGLTAWEWEVKKAQALQRGENTVKSKGGKAAALDG